MGAAAAARRLHRESRLLLLLCGQWHCQCHDEEKGAVVPSLAALIGTRRRRPSGDSGARTSPQWLSVCPSELESLSSSVVCPQGSRERTTWPGFPNKQQQQKRATIFFCTLPSRFELVCCCLFVCFCSVKKEKKK